MFHRYVNFFVEPLEKLFPWSVTFYRPDNKEGLFARRRLPLGYWLGHLIAYVLPALILVIVLK